GYLAGELGTPPAGFAEPFRARALPGRRPGPPPAARAPGARGPRAGAGPRAAPPRGGRPGRKRRPGRVGLITLAGSVGVACDRRNAD
ncbi:hypothetical protein, partial [Frankia sp. AgB1.8]|uniref:hypothetical protein n=1 Tax=Frankia sp. AgB1.8 TaxID=2792839 RepID=UPI001EE3A62E